MNKRHEAKKGPQPPQKKLSKLSQGRRRRRSANRRERGDAQLE